jgi:hypothetical protein
MFLFILFILLNRLNKFKAAITRKYPKNDGTKDEIPIDNG